MKFFSHLNTATDIIQQYGGREPLHSFLKKFFSQHKKYGSKDRRRISHLCYIFFRVGKMAVPGTSHQELTPAVIQETIIAGLVLCSHEPDELLEAMKPEWNEKVSLSVVEKVAMLNQERGHSSLIDLQHLFPWQHELSEGIDKDHFALSHLQQPDLFLRTRPGFEKSVLDKLQTQKLEYELIPPHSIRLPNGCKVDDLFSLDREVVVQDLSSQRVGELLATGENRFITPISVWDCCAASGGKSIMVKDILGDVDLTVSDVRESILLNLKKRFKVAGIANYHSFVADLSTNKASAVTEPQRSHNHFVPDTPYDIILADLPCTGSGTWGRTPEQLYFFEPFSIAKYSQLQKQICSNVIPHLKKSGKLLYVTCSVFKKENEEVVQFIQNSFSMKLDKAELLTGYNQKADTMYAAMLSRL